MNQALLQLIGQVGYAIPFLLVYLLAIVLAAINMRRAFLPSLVTLLASGILILVSIARLALQTLVISYQQYSYLNTISMITNAFQAIALSALVVAIFLGRGAPCSPPPM